MIIIIFNIQCLGEPPKKYAFENLIRTYNLNIILIKETMVEGEKKTISYVLKGCDFLSCGIIGRFWGLKTTWS